MNEQGTSGSSTTTSFVIRWVQEIQVNALVHASDNFNIFVAIMLALLAAAAAAGIALGAGALHPVVVYIVLGACGLGTVLTGGLSVREYLNVRTIRSEIRAATTEYRVPFTLTTGTGASPAVTLGQAGTALTPAPPPPSSGQSSDSATETQVDP